MEDLRHILRLTAGVGEELLRCGAEIARVEETMDRIACHYGATRRQIYVVANGVMVNLERGEEDKRISIRPIGPHSVDMTKLCQLNSLSREIEQRDLPLDEALRRYDAIKGSPEQNPWSGILASGIGAAAFCFLLGGDWTDSLGALLMGCLVWAFLLLPRRIPVSRVLMHLAGSLLATVGSILLFHLGLVHHQDQTIIGSILPMIPGVSFINGVRDLADSNHISGIIRLLDALLLFCCIVAGVYIALGLEGRFG